MIPVESTTVDLFDSTYRSFESEVLARVRARTFGDDFGQNSWLLADEFREWIGWLRLDGDAHVLEVASGSGGPAIRLAESRGCRVTGIDINEHGVATASERARARSLDERVTFLKADADAALPFHSGAFDAILCIDSANHFRDRLAVLQEWYRLLGPGGRILFTDPVVVTGPVSNAELALRSSIGHFVFSPPGVNERLIEEAGLSLVRRQDATAGAALVSRRWHEARSVDRPSLIGIEGPERYEGLQRFFETVYRLAEERRLSRFVYLARKES
jgi:SAM-dependent methyltransferase